MVKLEAITDESFEEDIKGTSDGALLVDDDADYTDTGMLRST